MSDLAQAIAWLGVLGAGLGVGVLLRRAGLASTYVRELVHVGASVWVFGWPSWQTLAAPALIVLGALLFVSLVPVLGDRVSLLGKVRASLSGGDERWAGITLYVLSFATFTLVGLEAQRAGGSAFPSAAALSALAWGDGIGGLVGRRFGRHRFRVPWAKEKSVEGGLAVALFSWTAIFATSAWFSAPVGLGASLGIACAAAAVEAVSPRASDNVLLPAVVWILLVFRA